MQQFAAGAPPLPPCCLARCGTLTQQHQAQQLVVAAQAEHTRTLGGRPADQQAAGRACMWRQRTAAGAQHRSCASLARLAQHSKQARHSSACMGAALPVPGSPPHPGAAPASSPAHSMCSCSWGTHSGSSPWRGPLSATANSLVRSLPPLQRHRPAGHGGGVGGWGRAQRLPPQALGKAARSAAAVGQGEGRPDDAPLACASGQRGRCS